jgi:hypothetical protein
LSYAALTLQIEGIFGVKHVSISDTCLYSIIQFFQIITCVDMSMPCLVLCVMLFCEFVVKQDAMSCFVCYVILRICSKTVLSVFLGIERTYIIFKTLFFLTFLFYVWRDYCILSVLLWIKNLVSIPQLSWERAQTISLNFCIWY